jgi:hypothetical protein
VPYPCLVQEPVAPPNEPQTPSPLRRRVVPRAWDADAPRMARPRRGPGKPGPARVHVHPRCEAEPCSCLAAPPLASTSPYGAHTHPCLAAVATPRPRHGFAMRGDHVPLPRRRVRVTARPLRPYPGHPSGATHTHPRFPHTPAHTLARRTGSRRCRTKSGQG